MTDTEPVPEPFDGETAGPLDDGVAEPRAER